MYQSKDYTEADNILRRKDLKIKFVGLYVLSVALLVFIVILLLPRTASVDVIADAKPLDNMDVAGNDILSKVELVSVQYKKLRQLDLEYSRKIVDSANATDLINLSHSITEVEKNLVAKIESLENLAKVYTDPKTANVLRGFAESFRFVMNDRTSLQGFRTVGLSKNNLNFSQPGMLTIQNEIQARDSRIAALEEYIGLLGNKSSANMSVANKIVANQQNIDELRTVISEQEKKIASLTATNTVLEKDNQANSEALSQMKNGTDNNSGALKSQNAMLEKMVNDLSVEVSLAQVDCNLMRADAGQIISNSKQRRILLSNAFTTLKNLSVAGDAATKVKVLDKINRLNKIAATVHD